MKFNFQAEKGAFAEGIFSFSDNIARAGTVAIDMVAAQAKAEGRASIAAAGFSKKWQNALRADVYPKKGVSMKAAAAIYHKIPYADVFESGASIRGNPTLWIPLPGLPKKLAGKRPTPKSFSAMVAPLFPLRTKGNTKILAAQMAVGKAAQKRGPPYKLNMSAVRRGAAGQGITAAVPVFVGVDTVNIQKKFNVLGAVESAAARIGGFYLAALRD